MHLHDVNFGLNFKEKKVHTSNKGQIRVITGEAIYYYEHKKKVTKKHI